MATTPQWVPHPANHTRFLIGKNWMLLEGDVFEIAPGATRCIKDYTFQPGEVYRWTRPTPPALAKVLRKLGRSTLILGPELDAAGISGGEKLPNGTYNRQPNFPVGDIQMEVRYERLQK